MITATGTAVTITEAGENVFRACFTDPYQGSHGFLRLTSWGEDCRDHLQRSG